MGPHLSKERSSRLGPAHYYDCASDSSMRFVRSRSAAASFFTLPVMNGPSSLYMPAYFRSNERVNLVFPPTVSTLYCCFVPFAGPEVNSKVVFRASGSYSVIRKLGSFGILERFSWNVVPTPSGPVEVCFASRQYGSIFLKLDGSLSVFQTASAGRSIMTLTSNFAVSSHPQRAWNGMSTTPFRLSPARSSDPDERLSQHSEKLSSIMSAPTSRSLLTRPTNTLDWQASEPERK